MSYGVDSFSVHTNIYTLSLLKVKTVESQRTFLFLLCIYIYIYIYKYNTLTHSLIFYTTLSCIQGHRDLDIPGPSQEI
jgi:hypothetical protein